MSSIMPDGAFGGVVVRDNAGLATNPANVPNAYVPAAGFAISTLPTAYPVDCGARWSPAQTNAIVSEILALAEALDPDGPWDTTSLTNLASAFISFRDGSGPDDLPTIITALTTALFGAAIAGKQPLDADLTAIAALSTTAFGRALLALADAAAMRSAAALGSVATLTAGTAGLNVPQLDALGRLPAIDGSQLTGLPLGGASTIAGAADLLAGEEGVAFDLLTRTAVINDYADVLSDSGRPDNILTVTRSSVKWITNRSRLLASVSDNLLAYDHDPISGAPKGALLEPARTNLLLQSGFASVAGVWQLFHTAYGFGSNWWTYTPNDTTYFAPDGVSRPIKCVGLGINDLMLRQAVAQTDGVAYAPSLWVLYPSGPNITYSTNNDANGISGTIVASPTWQRLTPGAFTKTAPGSGFLDIELSPSNVTLYVWGAQMEAGSAASSYIPTTTATVARSADSITMATSLFPLAASQGTLLLEATYAGLLAPAEGCGAISLYSGGNFISSRVVTDPVNPYCDALAADVDTANIAITNGPVVRRALAYATNDLAQVINGGAPSVDTSVVIPAVSTLAIGGGWSTPTAAACQMWLRRAAYISRRMTNAEIQVKTS